MTAGLAIAAALCCVILLIWPLRGKFAYIFAMVLAAAAFCRQLVPAWTLPADYAFNDVAATTPPLTTVDVVIVTVGLLSFAFDRSSLPFRWILPGALALLVGSTLVWPVSGATTAGAIHLASCLVAWLVGTRLGRALSTSSRDLRFGAFSVTLFMALQASLCLIQISVGGASDRTVGTFNHPSVVGKLVLLLMPLLLPMTRSTDRITARVAAIGTLLGALVTASTLSRANFVGLMGALGLWLVLSSRTGNKARGVVIAIAALGVALPFVDSMLARFATDATEDQRAGLLDAGLRVTSRYLWTGTGPNNYVDVAATIEPMVARWGAPVHNSTLLLVAELGLVGAAAMLTPIVRTIADAFRGRKQLLAQQRDIARATLVVMPMVLFVSWTGWGFLSAPVLPVLYLVCGYASGALNITGRYADSADEGYSHSRHGSSRPSLPTRSLRNAERLVRSHADAI